MLRSKRGDYSELLTDDKDDVPLKSQKVRHDQTLEAEVLKDDTLVSISLRFNCSVQDIKRLNKIQKDNEIFAYKVLKVPLTAENVLLDTLPKVHKSGQNSPKNKEKASSSTSDAIPSQEKLEEKLLLASVSNAVIAKSEDAADRTSSEVNLSEAIDPLSDNAQFRGYPRTFGAPRNDYMSFNGSDCELNWVVLLFCILGVCVIVPLIYVWLVYEHPEDFHPHHSIYDDTDMHQKYHLNDIHNATTSRS